MTYNFDIDGWHDRQLALLERKREKGKLDEAAFKAACEELDRRVDELWRRLDNSYHIPRRAKD